MSFILQPWNILLAALCGLVNQRQQQIIEFQNAQIETLLQESGKKRLLLDNNQLRLLAVKAHAIGRKALREITTIFMPDTMLRWHRKLVAKKRDSSDKHKLGRPRIRLEVVEAIVRFARENPTRGYDRIQRALANIGYHIADSTVANRLKEHGIEPAPDRQRLQSWSTFLKAHWDSIFAADFTTVEVWTRNGLVTFYVLAVMHLKTRRVNIEGITPGPNTQWMTHCREINDDQDGFLKDACHLIVARDTSFIAMHDFLDHNTDTKVVLLPPTSPNLNAYIERWFRSLKSECLDPSGFSGVRLTDFEKDSETFLSVRFSWVPDDEPRSELSSLPTYPLCGACRSGLSVSEFPPTSIQAPLTDGLPINLVNLLHPLRAVPAQGLEHAKCRPSLLRPKKRSDKQDHDAS